VGSCDEEGLLAVAGFGEVETGGSLSVRCGLNSDEERECRSKRTVNVDGWVKVGNGLEEAWTGRPGVDGLPELDLDVVDSELLEKVQAAMHCGVGILTGECLESDTNAKHDGADGLSLRP